MKDKGSTSWYKQNTLRWFPVSPAHSHPGMSPQVTVYSAWIFAEHGMESGASVRELHGAL